MERVGPGRRHRAPLLAGLAAAEAAAAALAVVVAFLASTRGNDGSLPAEAPDPTPAPSPVLEAPADPGHRWLDDADGAEGRSSARTS